MADLIDERKLAPHLSKLMMDAGQIQQVILNLLMNAGEAMPHGGSLSIETHPTDCPGGEEDDTASDMIEIVSCTESTKYDP